MSRLNATIKLLFCWGELFFVLVSLLFVVFSGLTSIGYFAALSFPSAKKMATWVLLLSGAVLLCTGFGCLGAIRQTLRRGCCSGRKILCMHQLLLFVVVIFSVSQYEWLNKREQGFKLVTANPASYPEYDGFEQRMSTYFNGAYFDSVCSPDESSSKWLLNFVGKKCPGMGQEYCALSESRKKSCDTSCASSDPSMCCPSEDLCSMGNLESCPYHRCRVQILEELHGWAGPAKLVSQAILFLSFLMLILSLLLICFNPRDEIEIELLKTGVMTAEDVEAIRRLKDSAQSVATGKSIDASVLVGQSKTKFGNSSSRKRNNCRVSPTNV